MNRVIAKYLLNLLHRNPFNRQKSRFRLFTFCLDRVFQIILDDRGTYIYFHLVVLLWFIACFRVGDRWGGYGMVLYNTILWYRIVQGEDEGLKMFVKSRTCRPQHLPFIFFLVPELARGTFLCLFFEVRPPSTNNTQNFVFAYNVSL